MDPTVGALVDRTIAAHQSLAAIAEPIEDEWQYVSDLGAVWQARLRNVASARDGEAVAEDVARAVDRVTEEAGLVTDPHRAIDWLSTLPQVVLEALGEAS